MATKSWPQSSRSAVTPWDKTAGSLEISTATTRHAGFTPTPRLKGAVRYVGWRYPSIPAARERGRV
jgi:hypothetical protein